MSQPHKARTPDPTRDPALGRNVNAKLLYVEFEVYDVSINHHVVLTFLAVFARRVDWNGPSRIDVAIRSENLEEGVDKLLEAGAKLTGLMAYTAERVKALEPAAGVDLDDKTIPHEIPHWIGRGR